MSINVNLNPVTSLLLSSSLTSLNTSLSALADEFDKVVYKDGREELTGNLDANSKRIINLPAPIDPTEPARLADLATVTPEVFTVLLATKASLSDFSASTGSTLVNHTYTGVGVTPVRTVAEVLKERISVADFVKVIAGTNHLAAIQAAEDAAATLAAITGSGVELYWPEENYNISGSIQKKTGVHWRGSGRIQRLNYASATGASFSLVVANGTTDWSIDGLHFRNVTRNREIDGGMTWGVAPGTMNACIDIYGCSRFSVRHCTMRQFTFGINYRGCSDGFINDNWLYADNNKTVTEIDNNTYSQFTPFIAGSGGITVLYEAGGTPSAISRDMQICGNHVEVPGLDIAIEALGLTYDAQRILVVGNTIRGCTTGIQGYRGSMADPGTAPTYNSGLIIALNRVMLSWGAGVYLRGLVGGQVYGNTFERCGKIGMDGSSSAGSMVFRVNPFTAGGTFGAPASPVSNDHAMLVFGNRVIDHGREDVACDPAVLIEYDGVKFTGNEVQRSDERFNTARGAAIYVGNGKAIKNAVVNGNTVTGKWTYGIFLTDILRATSVSTHWAEIKGNTLNGEFTSGIETNWNAFNVDIDDNILHGVFTDGIKLRFSPLSKITRNKLRGTFVNGILLAGGSLLSDVPYITSGGTITRANRRGGSTTVEDNDVWGATTPYAVSETTGSDALFWSRCISYERNSIRGQVDVLEFGTSGTPGLTNAPRVWHKHATTRNSGLAAGQPLGKICSVPGQGGSTTTATGTTAVGSPIITAVSSLDGWAPGIYLTMAEFTGVRKIIAIDTTLGTITVDGNATTATVGATITPSTPTFITLPNAV